jgi:hypothetical protein
MDPGERYRELGVAPRQISGVTVIPEHPNQRLVRMGKKNNGPRIR